MNVKMPGKSSITISISGAGDATPKKNDLVEKRMDLLEKKLDEHYKRVISGKPKESKELAQLNKAFMAHMAKIDRLISMQKNSKPMRPQVIVKRDVRNINLNPLLGKFDELEKSISAAFEKKQKSPNGNLEKSFDRMFQRLEKAIKQSGPRMIPSPS